MYKKMRATSDPHFPFYKQAILAWELIIYFTRSSTRRFCALPSWVELLAIGMVSP
jgi:hypothetical protein